MIKRQRACNTAAVGLGVLLSLGLARPARAIVFQAEDYNAFHDTTPGNQGGAYRADDVDIEPTTDTGGGYDVGWIDAGEWLAFNNLVIPTTGSYTIRFRVASPGGATLSADLNGGSIVLGQWAVPATGGWQTWTTMSQTVNITAGTYALGVFAQTAGFNLNWVEVVPNTPAAPVTVYKDCNFGGYAVALQTGSYTLTQLRALGVVNDDISSLKVAAGFQATLYQNDNFGGASVVKTADDSCLVDDGFNDATSSVVVAAVNSGAPGTANGFHKRLKIINGCGQDMWVQWNTAPGVAFADANFQKVSGVGSFVEYNVPDKGLPSMRFWPGFGCDATGHNCRVGASGGPANLGFTCPATGCAPPIDSKFEASFGCIPGVTDAQCAQNPSAPGTPLGRGDWWNSSMVDGYTVPVKVQVRGSCPVGPQPAPVFGPGGPPGGVVDCSGVRVAECPTNENLSSNGQFANLASVNLQAINPATGGVAGCYSPGGKLTFNQWANGFTTYSPADAHAQLYSCPTPPVSPTQCSSGPAAHTEYHDEVHAHCATYTYPYDDGVGLSSCPAATNLVYEVTFYCPQ